MTNINITYTQADPFLIVSLGKKKFSTRDTYVPNNLNPIFGKYVNNLTLA